MSGRKYTPFQLVVIAVLAIPMLVVSGISELIEKVRSRRNG